MQTGGDKNLERVREEHTKRIFELYQSRAKNFRNTIIALFFFGFFFLYFILVPYVLIRASEENINESLNSLQAETDRVEKRIDFYRAQLVPVHRFPEPEWKEQREKEINDNLKALVRIKDGLKKEKPFLKQQKIQLQNEKEQLAERLKEIESPFGKLPIELSESIVIFPVLLAIGFSISALLFSETIRLRRAFHTLSQQEDSGRALLTDEQIALVAPLWYDPVNSVWNQIIQVAILSMPFVFFMLACILILVTVAHLNLWVYYGMYFLSFGVFAYSYGRIIIQILVTVAQLNLWVYYGMYFLSFGVFAYSYGRIIIQIRHYWGKRDENGNEME